MSLINSTVIKNELSRTAKVRLSPPPGGRIRVAAKILGSERSGCGCRAARRERVWQEDECEKLLTVAEAASILRLHPVTVRALAAAGTVPAVKIGRAWRFVEVDLLAWARANYCRADAVG